MDTTQEVFDDFQSNTTESRIVKKWSITYRGIEYDGTVTTTYEISGSWEDHEYCITDSKDLTDDELDELEDYVMDLIK